MKPLSRFCVLTALLMSVLAISATAQITPSDDSYTLTSSPTINFGAKNILQVQSAGATTFVRFDLSSIPPAVTGAMVAKATLKIYVGTVTTAGSFNVDLVTSAWTEKTITANTAPTLGSAIASAVPVTTADKNQYVLVDVTAAVVEWLNGTSNDGLALVPDGAVSFSLNSKETTTTSHPPELDIVLSGPQGPPGPISGVTAGAGLAGGGTKGNVTLSLLTTCASGQVLQWNGSTWACAATGTGTITGVTAGTDLTGGGTSGNVTLNLDTTRVPLLSAANTFVGNQSITGNLSFSGSITGQTGLFNANNGGSVVGVTQSGSGTGISVSSNTFGVMSVSPNIAVEGLSTNNNVAIEGFTGSGQGVSGSASTASGVGVHGLYGTASVIGATLGSIGVWGDSSGGRGVFGTSDFGPGVEGDSTDNVGVAGGSLGNVGVFGSSTVSAGVRGAGLIGVVAVGSAGGVGLQAINNFNSNSGLGMGNAAVWGDTGVTGSFGVLGTVDVGNAFWGKNNTTANETLYLENDAPVTNGVLPLVARFAGPGSSTYCYIRRNSSNNGTGDLICTGSKSAAVVVDGGRAVRMYAVEASDNWFEDAGSSQLAGGRTSVMLDPTFSQTVNGGLEYHVFLTPKGDCEGLYVTNQSAGGFEVRELRGGHSNVAFDYRIMAKRKGFENVRMEDVTEDFTRMKAEAQLWSDRMEAEKSKPRPVLPAAPQILLQKGNSTTRTPVPTIGKPRAVPRGVPPNN